MKEPPIISILLPCYNAEKHLHEALESIIRQTYTNIEIIAIDDGSVDKTPVILKEHADRDNRIKVFTNDKNIGLIQTLNKGIEFCSGEFIARMDTDDISHPRRLEIQIACFRNNPELGLVSCAHKMISEHGKYLYTLPVIAQTPEANHFVSFFMNPFGHPAVIIKAEILKKHKYKFNSEIFHTEDYEIWTRMMRNGVKGRNIPQSLMDYRVHTKSVSHQYTALQDKNFLHCAFLHFRNSFPLDIPDSELTIIFNRFDNRVSYHSFLKAYKKIAAIRYYFQKLHNISGGKEKKEIRNFSVLWKIHLLVHAFQSFKGINKLMIGLTLIFKFIHIFNPFIYRQVKTKIKERKYAVK